MKVKIGVFTDAKAGSPGPVARHASSRGLSLDFISDPLYHTLALHVQTVAIAWFMVNFVAILRDAICIKPGKGLLDEHDEHETAELQSPCTCI